MSRLSCIIRRHGFIKNNNVMVSSFETLKNRIAKEVSAGSTDAVSPGLTEDDPADPSRWGKRQREVDATEAYLKIISLPSITKKLTVDFQHGLVDLLNTLASTNKDNGTFC